MTFRCFPRARPRERRRVRNEIELRKDKTTGEVLEICHGDAWQQRRQEVWERDKGKCRDCGTPIPLHNEEQHGIQKLVRRACEIHHLRKRGMGGSKRDDCKDNLVTLCWRCHNVRTARGE